MKFNWVSISLTRGEGGGGGGSGGGGGGGGGGAILCPRDRPTFLAWYRTPVLFYLADLYRKN